MALNILVLILSIFVVKQAHAANILVIPAKDSGSHLASMIEYVMKLADNGHSVHLIDTAFKTPKYTHKNLTTYSLFIEMNTTGFDPWKIIGNDPRRFGDTMRRKDYDFEQILKHHQKTVSFKLYYLFEFS